MLHQEDKGGLLDQKIFTAGLCLLLQRLKVVPCDIFLSSGNSLVSTLTAGPALTVRHREVDGITDRCSSCLTSVHPWCLHLNALLVGRQKDMAQVPESVNRPELQQQRVVPITSQGYSLPLEDGGPRWV